MTYDEFLNFLDSFEEIQSFRKRIEYANQNLHRLGSGSGRIVYDIDGQKVFKIAKNPKGVAQNEEEVNISAYDYNHDLVTKVFEYDNSNLYWVISEKGRKVTPNRIKELTGIPSLHDLELYLRNFESTNKGGRSIFGIDSQIKESLDNNEWVQDLLNIIYSHDMNVGDMGRPSTYGEVIRGGQPAIVLTDYGLSSDVYQSHYAPKRSGGRLYELIDLNRGGIYQEFTDGNSQGDAWWGLQPQTVSDGLDPVNENFVRFVENRNNFIIRRPIFGITTLSEEFHKAVNHTPSYVAKAQDKKKFFENLIKLQEYLIEQGAYNKDRLILVSDKELTENYTMNEDGSSLYSTPNSVGNDDFPVYNQDNLEPSIENNLDANSAMYNEDLEYNHVEDATQDQYKLSEERKKAWIPGSKAVNVKKKCKLAGLGNTSAACNQGEIENLEFSPLNEIIDLLESINEDVVGKQIKEEISTLQELPFKNEIQELDGKIYSVGGAVRDEFLGKSSKDLDILITGIPMENLGQILSKYGRVDAVGKSFGILKFKPAGSSEEIDVAIPRTEKATGEGGHKGFDVTSDHNLSIEKDLKRRDFTINAIAKDINGNIVDPYGGQRDLKSKIIRIVNPEAFSDDPLRMLRAVQFAARFDFNIEPNTLKMIQNNAHRIKEIPPERIITEFEKIVKKGNKSIGAQLLMNTGLYGYIFGNGNVKPHKVSSLFDNVKTIGEFVYLLGLGVVQNPAEFYKNNLKGDIPTYKEIQALEIGRSDETSDLIKNRTTAYNIYKLSPKTLKSELLPIPVRHAGKEMEMGKYPKSIGELEVNGNDLKSMGFEGPEIGNKLKELLINVYADKVRNNRQELLNLLNYRPSENLNEGDFSKQFDDVKNKILRSKKIPKELKEKIILYIDNSKFGSRYNNGVVTNLKIPKIKGKKFDGVSMGADKNGFFVHTHRARSKSKESPDKIPQKDIDLLNQQDSVNNILDKYIY